MEKVLTEASCAWHLQRYRPHPPESRKQDVMPDAPRLLEIDKHALQAPHALRQDVQGLVDYLTLISTNDIETTRVLCRWISHNINYDVARFRSCLKTSYANCDIAEILKTSSATCDGYAKLFTHMCRLSGIHCERIQGSAKGADYLPGTSFQNAHNFCHEWNAVHVTGSWRLVDCCWAAGYLLDGKDKFIKTFQEHYFLTDPSEFVRDHFPKEDCWQLLQHPRTFETFLSDINVKPGYFTFGVQICEDTDGIVCFEKESYVSLTFTRPLSLVYRLLNLDTHENCSSFVTYTQRLDGAKFRIRPLFQGAYTFSVYGKERDEEGDFLGLFTIYMRCQTGSTDDIIRPTHPFPWGPTEQFYELGLKCKDSLESFITSNFDNCGIAFKITKSLSFWAELRNINNEPSDLGRRVLWDYYDNSVHFHVRPPDGRIYHLAIYAKEQGDFNLHCIGNYMVQCSVTASRRFLFPHIRPAWNQGCRLVEPLIGSLVVMKASQFSLHAPGATSVILVHKHGAKKLNKFGVDLWRGSMIVREQIPEICVCAKFPGRQKYDKLLTYDIVKSRCDRHISACTA